MSNRRLLGNEWLKHEKSVLVEGVTDNYERPIWFKSEPLTRDFCQRVVQLQLCTDSHDQGFANDVSQGSWTWFELAILPNAHTDTPKRTKEGNEMAWQSHANQVAHKDATMHYGLMFDRRSELLANIEVGDVLAVRACARFPGWKNYANKAVITTRLIKEDLFPNDLWTLSSTSLAKHGSEILDCVYSYSAPTGVFVRATDANIQSKIWFSTPALTAEMIDKLESIQLLTRARRQRGDGEAVCSIAEEESFSWFDIVVLEHPDAEEPKIVTGVSMVWLSHKNTCNDFDKDASAGQLWDESLVDQPRPSNSLVAKWQERAAEIKAIKSALEPGNAIGVRVCAQFAGWEAYAPSGHLVVRISNESRPAPDIAVPDFSAVNNNAATMKSALLSYQAHVVLPAGAPPFTLESPDVTMLDAEVRADAVMQVAPPPYAEREERPLRLLSLDGGGVRGVSELCILKKVMNAMPTVAKQPTKEDPSTERAPHPYEVFDMIAGTSTGGLIALMLGRLKMSIAECEAAYDVVSKAIFGKLAGNVLTRNLNNAVASFATGSYMYAAEPLIREVKKLVMEKLGNDHGDTMLMDDDKDACKVFVVTCRANKTETGQNVVKLRSYATTALPNEYTFPEIKIWEAARATSAAPAYFERLRVTTEDKEEHQFIDGGMVYNNPSPLVLAEVGKVFGPKRPIGCLLSLGTGVPLNVEFSDGPMPVSDLIGLVTNGENAASTSQEQSISFPWAGEDKYVRLNLSKALSDTHYPAAFVEVQRTFGFGKKKVAAKDYAQMMKDMDDWQGIARIRALTDEWLKYEGDAISGCVKLLTRTAVEKY